MVLGQTSEQVDQDNTSKQPRKTMRALWMCLPVYVRGLSVSVLLLGVSLHF